MAPEAGAGRDPTAIRGVLTEAKGVAAGLPDLLIEARRVSATVMAGWHGRRVPGRGETFWQFRPFVPGEAASSVDWRRSARDEQHLFVREKEWEAAHTMWLWADLSASMNFRSRLGGALKRDRAVMLLLALSELLAAAGERVGLLGESDHGAGALLDPALLAAVAGRPAHLPGELGDDLVVHGQERLEEGEHVAPALGDTHPPPLGLGRTRRRHRSVKLGGRRDRPLGIDRAVNGRDDLDGLGHGRFLIGWAGRDRPTFFSLGESATAPPLSLTRHTACPCRTSLRSGPPSRGRRARSDRHPVQS